MYRCTAVPQPLYQALPALQSAAAAAETRARGGGGGASMMRPFSALSRRLETSLQSVGMGRKGQGQVGHFGGGGGWEAP